ncbi:MAG: alpha/beta fold hydrolase [Bacteroidota bacterium]
MQLFYRLLGESNTQPLIILHGLYGSSDNWLNIGKQLAQSYRVYLIDLRNHGNSPHSKNHNYFLMRDDLLEFMEDKGIREASVLGHSMGGKTAIYFALEYPDKVKNMIVVDIAPGAYKSLAEPSPNTLNHLNILNALYNLDTENIETLRDADKKLSESIPYKQVRQFLLKNLKRDKKGKFRWTLNINTLRNELPSIVDGIDTGEYSGKSDKPKESQYSVLFIKGEKSDYIGENEKNEIKTIFPNATIQTIKDAGHWVHAEQREMFIDTVRNFLSDG